MTDSTSNSDREYQLYTHNFTPERILGDVDANFEWSHNEDSSDLFVQTSSYDRYKENDIVFLFGRRGTGKSAMIQMLDYQIKTKLNKTYNYSALVQQESAYHDLTISIRLSEMDNILPKGDLIHIFKEKWLWVFYVSAFKELVEQEKGAKDDDVKLIAKYVKSALGVLSPVNKAVTTITDELASIDFAPAKIGVAIFKASKRLFTPEFETTLVLFKDFLKSKNKKILIQVDSKERYQFDDLVAESIMSAIIEAALKIHNDNDNIYIKVAFPSEIFPHLPPLNKEKTETRTLFILWRYKDLYSLIEKRYQNLLNRKIKLYDVMPKRIKSYPGIVLDTFSYIVSHTQKKPRQIIQVFNNLMTLAKENNIPFESLTEEVIREGVNCRTDLLSSGTLNMYDSLYPNATKIAKKVFSKSVNVFNANELDKMIKEASSFFSTYNGMNRENVRRLFVESGILGVVNTETELKDDRKIITAEFEYQIKGTLNINNRVRLAIHPMFYQGFETRSIKKTIIYPKPSPNEQHELELLETEVAQNN